MRSSNASSGGNRNAVSVLITANGASSGGLLMAETELGEPDDALDLGIIFPA
jgi:hypothetical protein